MKIDEKQKKIKRNKKNYFDIERSWAHFILMKPGEEGVGVVD